MANLVDGIANVIRASRGLLEIRFELTIPSFPGCLPERLWDHPGVLQLRLLPRLRCLFARLGNSRKYRSVRWSISTLRRL